MKQAFNNFKIFIKNVFEKYPVTYISSMLFSLILCIFVYKDIKVVNIILTILVSLGILAFLIESRKDNKHKLLYYILSLIFSIIVGLFLNLNILDNSYFYRFLIALYLSIFIYGIYINYKNTKKSFSDYLIGVFSNTFKVSIINGVLMIGIILILLIFDYLIIPGSMDCIEKILIIILGFYYIPSVIYSFNKIEKTTPFINVLVSKVLFIQVLIAYLIIYAYIIKILVLRSMPSNTIFTILTCLFIFSTFICIMSKAVEKNKVLIKINNLIPYLFIPFILLQIYSIVVRINTYGLTISRYLAVSFLVFEIAYTIFNITKKDIGKILLFMIIEIILILLIPYINCYNLPINLQYKEIKEYSKTNKVTPKVKGAYYYLTDYDEGNKRINKILKEEQIEKITSSKISQYDESLYGSVNVDNIDIKGYDKIIFVNYDSLDSYNIDLTDYIEKCIENKDDFNKYLESNNVVELDNKKLIISSIDITYGKKTNYYVYGYLLIKE